MNQGKLKTVLCKHFGQTGTCSYGEKCQFAHGFQELKNSGSSMQNNMGSVPMMGMDNSQKMKSTPNPSNFKIVKCKNFETTGSCKYGSVCTFAHGDNEIRTKSDNNIQMSENAITMDSGLGQNTLNPYLMQDPNYIYNMMMQQQMMMGGMPMDYSQMGQMGMMGGIDQSQQGMNNINLNDYNNMFLQQQMMQGMQGMQGLQGQQQVQPQDLSNNYDYMNYQGLNNMNNNMFMGNNTKP